MSLLFKRLTTAVKNSGVTVRALEGLRRPGIRMEFASAISSDKLDTVVDHAPANMAEEADVLYKRLEVEVRGHDQAVLKSYECFTTTAAKHLEIDVTRTWVPNVVKLRRRALKSAFAHGKHIVHYEFRTYFKVMEFKHLTGSTADTFLEYIQRNLPEGVAMKVTKERIEKIPDHIRPPPISAD